MSGWEDELVDPFLSEVGEEVDGEGLEALVSALEPSEIAPSASLRDRLLASATLAGRFDRFSAQVAEFLDVTEARARELLDGIGRDENWTTGLVPDVFLYDIEGGPKVANAITGFIRMSADVPFPEHGHMGHEVSLIIQGSGIDNEGNVWRVGDVVEKTPDQMHGFKARPGPDLVFLVIVQDGIRLGDMVLGPDDPRI